MTGRPRVGLALIAKDEADRLPTLLASIEGAFDRVVLLDTGSTDSTVDVFARWAKQQPGMTYSVGFHRWQDDFAAARNEADTLLLYGTPRVDPQTQGAVVPLVDWLVWADCDDELHGARHLRDVVAAAPPDLAAYGAGYDYAQDHAGTCVCYLRRERVVRAGHGGWAGRVHEAQLIRGRIDWIDPALVEWRHRKPIEHAGTSNTRNRRILKAWAKAEPRNPRVIGYLGTELAGAGQHKQAITWFRRYQQLEVDWPEERAQMYRKWSASLFALGRVDQGIDLALEALRHHPTWPDSYLTLAEGYYHRREFEKAAAWAERVLDLGVPDTLLIINPTDYTGQPHLILAAALGELGRHAEAIVHADRGLAVMPGHEALTQARARSAGRKRRDDVARTIVRQAQDLVAHDEQLKALVLLEQTVPYYAADHPEVVLCRSQLRERMAGLLDGGYAARYGDQSPKLEDERPLPEQLAIVARLPRARFLAEGLAEQLEAAA